MENYMQINSVGVVGAGVMGVGVAHNLALAGYHTLLVDISDEILERAKNDIIQNIRMQGLIDANSRSVDPDQVINKITFSKDLGVLASANYVIENIVEKWEEKKEVYTQLSSFCPKDCIFAANTSAISITRIASATDRPTQVIGIHFMNPVPLKSMVEVIKGFHTSDKTIETTRALLSEMKKECIVVNDYPGFVSNRVLMLTINEAIFLVQDDVTSPENVDKIFKGCFGHKMGPLETGDLIGLDTILYSLDALYEGYNDSKFRPAPLLKKMVDAGLHGRKSGKGFYTYQV